MVSSVTGIYVVNKLPKQKEKRLINYWNYYLSIQCKVLYFFLYLYKPKAITMKSFILWNRLSIFSFSWENILNLLCKFNWTRMENKWKMIRNLMKLNWNKGCTTNNRFRATGLYIHLSAGWRPELILRWMSSISISIQYITN